MRIAIIGAGIAGLTAAWRLRDRHDITLFEVDSRPGGHAHTHRLRVMDREITVDTGFIVYNDRNYPCFTRLLAELGIAGEPTSMSFSVSCASTGIEYNGGSIRGLVAQPTNLLRPQFWRMLQDILRFNREARQLLAQGASSETLAGFLERGGYGKPFMDRYLLPMGAAIWSIPTGQVRDFPARQLAEFFANHGLLSLTNRPHWYTIAGGSARYVSVIAEVLGKRLRRQEAVVGLRRDDGGVELRTRSGTARFDEVIIACHSDQALALLEDPSVSETELLTAIRFQSNAVTLHHDPTLMPQSRAAWASWNYHIPASPTEASTVTYWMNHLQHIECPVPLLVTLNRHDAIDPACVLAEVTYAHPILDEKAVAAQARRGEISGQRHTWYCGAWWGYGFHEDGCRSAEEVASALP